MIEKLNIMQRHSTQQSLPLLCELRNKVCVGDGVNGDRGCERRGSDRGKSKTYLTYTRRIAHTALTTNTFISFSRGGGGS